MFSSLNAVFAKYSELEEFLTVYGIDWTPREQSMLAGLQLVLLSTVDPAPSLRALLNMVGAHTFPL